MSRQIEIDEQFLWPYNGGVNAWAKVRIRLHSEGFEHADRVQITKIKLVDPSKREPKVEMVPYCDCGDYCEWCHPEITK